MIEQVFSINDVEAIDHQIKYKGFFSLISLQLKHRLFEGGWSDVLDREIFVRDNAVGVLLYDADEDRLVLVEQFRCGPYYQGDLPWMLEIVAGIIEPGEEPPDVARRESEEEANCLIQDLLPMLNYYSSPGGCVERMSLFCGKISIAGAGGVHGLDNEAEDIRVHCLSSDEALECLEKGQIRDATTIIALQWLQLNKSRVIEKWRA